MSERRTDAEDISTVSGRARGSAMRSRPSVGHTIDCIASARACDDGRSRPWACAWSRRLSCTAYDLGDDVVGTSLRLFVHAPDILPDEAQKQQLDPREERDGDDESREALWFRTEEH